MTAKVSPEEMSGKEGAFYGPPAPQPVFPHQVASAAQPYIATVNPAHANATYNTTANYQAPTGQAVFVTASSSAQQMQQPQTYGYVMAQQVQQPLSQAERSASTCWLIVGILSAIFCCLPLGIAGAITAYLSKEDAERGSAVNHRRRLCQAKGLTAAAIAVGLLAILAVGITVGLLTASWNVHYDNGGYQDDYDGSRDGPFEVQTWTDEGIYLGCYEDHAFSQDLLDLSTVFSGAENSVDTCVKHCSDRGYKYAGLQYSTECHCGNSYGKHGKLDESKCNYVCEADGRQCGGYSDNSVYRTNYLGCFNDDAYNSMTDYSASLYEGITPESCTSHCGSIGYEFAGVQNSDRCYCGNDPNRYGETTAFNCFMPCEGASDLTCGGSDTSSVYKTEHLSGESYGYLGCYQDSPIVRDLSGYYEYHGWFSSVEICVVACALQGYKYAGLQSGTECFCSQSYGVYTKVHESYCDIDCHAGEYRICGGWDKNSVYRTSYVGCFEDESERALNVTASLYYSDATPSLCLSECESKGYLFAGVQNGNECHCGHDMNRYREAPAHECSTPCGGDDEMICGGSYRNSVYRTTL